MKFLLAILTLALCRPSMADETTDLVKKLDADTFREREEAAQKLESLGKEAIPALVDAANGGPLETAIRSIDILKKIMEGENKEAAAEAKSALEKLGESENASTARRAKSALTPRPEPVPAAMQNRIQIGGFIPPVIAGNGVRRISMKTVNGVKTVEVDEGAKKITINEDPNTGITVEIKETLNGKETTEKFEAKTEADLKKNHPKAHAEYEKYGKGNGANIQINAGAIRIGAGGAALPVAPAFPAVGRAHNIRLDSAGRLLQSTTRHVESMANDNAIKGASQESRENFKQEVSDMKNRLAELEKKLQAAIDEENNNQAPKENAQNEKPANAER